MWPMNQAMHTECIQEAESPKAQSHSGEQCVVFKGEFQKKNEEKIHENDVFDSERLNMK